MESGAGEGYSVFSHMALPYRDGEISQSVADWWDRYVEQFNAAPEYSAMEGGATPTWWFGRSRPLGPSPPARR